MRARTLGPIPGILPPTQRHASTSNIASQGGRFPTSNSNNATKSYSYSMNWRPEELDVDLDVDVGVDSAYKTNHTQQQQEKEEEAEEEESTTKSMSLLNLHKQTSSSSSIFRVSLADSCPTVDCFSDSAFSCTVAGGIVCTLEETKPNGLVNDKNRDIKGSSTSWNIQFHPSQEYLSDSQTFSMSQAIYSCLYAALAKNCHRRNSHQQEDQISLVVSSNHKSLSPSIYRAISALHLPHDLSMPITPSYLLQMFQFADTQFLTPAFPYIDSFSWVAGVRVAHPLRKKSTSIGFTASSSDKADTPLILYTRYANELDRMIVIKGREDASKVTVRVELHSNSGRILSEDDSLDLSIAWALENCPIEKGYGPIDDYDQIIYWTDQDSNASRQATEAYVISLYHLLFLQDLRTRRILIWAKSASERITKITDALSQYGWRRVYRDDGYGDTEEFEELSTKDNSDDSNVHGIMERNVFMRNLSRL